MSSISRRRNGLMALSVIGGSCLCGRIKAPQSQDRTPASATSPVATNYRESGLVPCPFAAVANDTLVRSESGSPFAKHHAILRLVLCTVPNSYSLGQMQPRRIFIISDLHLGGEPAVKGSAGFQMCPPYARRQLARFIHGVARMPSP